MNGCFTFGLYEVLNVEVLDNKKYTEERVFLEGPHSRWKEFVFVVKVFFEFIKGFRKFHFLGPCVTVFGSARFKEDHPYYQKARELAVGLTRMGFTVMTGGGPGIMEAANRGAKDADGYSVGCNIVLPTEQAPNKYLDKWVTINYFFVRKVLLSKYSYAFIVMPGGYGTLDEFFEALTLIQTGKTYDFPVILFGKEYHTELHDYILKIAGVGTISAHDPNIFLFTDSIEEALSYLEKNAIEKFKLRKRKKRMKAIRILGEKKAIQNITSDKREAMKDKPGNLIKS